MSLVDAFLLDPASLDLCIALRTDGAIGSGTEDDPYDGSTRATTKLTVSSLTSSGQTAAATCNNHPFKDGHFVLIDGASGPDAAYYNGTFQISNVTSNSFQYTMWGAPVSSPATGTVTCQLDPYEFDAVMRSLGSSAVAVRLGPGTFETRGYTNRSAVVWSPPQNGMRLAGSGMEVTVLRLVRAVGDLGTYNLIGTGYGNTLDLKHPGFEAVDFTLDSNIAGQPSQAVECGAIGVAGSNTRLCRIRAINFGTEVQPNECFVLSAALGKPAYPERVNCWIAECIVEQPGFSNALETTCIDMVTAEDGTAGVMSYHRACVIRNCYVNCEYRSSPVPISSVTTSAGVATVNTRVPHGRQVDDWVRISGVILGGSMNNSFNGAYQISATPSIDSFQYTPNPAQESNPETGRDMWLGRWPSQVIAITAISAPPMTPPYISTVTTATPHFLTPLQTVLIENVPIPAYNGNFQVTVLSSSQFSIQFDSNPGPPGTLDGRQYIGVSFQGSTADGGTSALVEGNRFLNATVGGPYHDTWGSKDLIVRQNYYRAVGSGPLQNLGQNATTQDPQGVMSLTNVGTVATLTTKVAHGLMVGQSVRVQNANVGTQPSPYYNGYFPIVSVPSQTQFTYRMAGDPGGSAESSPAPTFGALWQVRELVIENNVLDLMLNVLPAGYSPPTAINLYDSGPGGDMQNFLFMQTVIRRNVMHTVDGATDTSGFPVGIGLHSCGKGVVEENVSDLNSLYPSPPAPINQVGSGSVKYLNNQTPAGNLVQGYIQDIGQYANEITTDIDLALLEAF
jgi:hypothetical protein